MAHPPGPKQRSYRGRIRADMRSAYNHLQALLKWNVFYRSRPMNTYPNQLWQPGVDTQMANAVATLAVLLSQLGPIPSR